MGVRLTASPFSGLFVLVVVVVASVLKIHEIRQKQKKKVKSENMQYSILAMKPFHNIILHKEIKKNQSPKKMTT